MINTRQWPLGARGEFPVLFPASLGPVQFKELVSMPGVKGASGGVRCTWDMAPFVASYLGVQCPTVPTDQHVDLAAEIYAMPGLQRYLDLGFKEKLRDYQKEGAVFLARRAYAMNADPMRSGKSLQALAGAVLTGAKKVLIVCPAVAKPVWADEVAKWTGEEAVMLEGRGGREARVQCVKCGGKGYTEEEVHCSGCKLKNGQSHGSRIARLGEEGRDLYDAVDKARFILVNYDLLVAQRASHADGSKYYDPNLPGWCPFLSQFHFDLCIADESHVLRGWNKDRSKAGQSRREKFVQATNEIPQVWMVTGTPIFGFTRDLWGQLDAMSRGALTGPNRLPFEFHVRYPVHEDSRVLCGDLRWRAIRQLKLGDEVWGWMKPEGKQSKRVFHRTSVEEVFDLGDQQLLEVTLENGACVRCTPDHRWAVLNANRRLRWVRTDELMTQQYRPTIMFVDMPRETPEITESYMRGYLRGVVAGDGTVRDDLDKHGHRRRSGSLRMQDREAVDRAYSFAQTLNLAVTYRGHKSEGWTMGIGAQAVSFFFEPLPTMDLEFIRGWLAGIWDAEGSGMVISQYWDKNPEIHDTICTYLDALGFAYTADPEAVRINGGRREFFRFVQFIDPAITRKTKNVNSGNHASGRVDTFNRASRVKVIDVQPAADGRALCVKTGTGNLIIEGMGSHNCDGQKGEYGWIADGDTPWTHTELPGRLDVIKIQRPRSFILKDMPAKVRTVYRIEPEAKQTKELQKQGRLGLGKNKKGRLQTMLTATGTAKRDTVVENVLTELAAGDKVIVFTLLRKNAEQMTKALRHKISKSRDWSARMKKVNAEVWLGHGDVSTKHRNAYAKAFKAHNGAAVFVATIDAMQVAVSLKGATSVHFAELHWSPAAMLQAEDRPYEPGTTGLNIIYYVMKGSIDEQVEATVMPKFKTQQEIVGEEGAASVRDAFKGEEESVDDILDRITAHIGDLQEEDDLFADLDD